MLRLHDTATGTVRPLELRDPDRVSMYVCGLTVDNSPHLGHGRFSLVFDVLRRYLLFGGLDVRYVSNITDVDDKIIARAAAEGTTETAVAARYEDEWWRVIDALGILRPTDVPRATAFVPQMVGLIEKLEQSGAAYEASDGVYLSVEKIDGYGLLNHQPLESLRAGARVEHSEDKRSPLDFALWKRAKPGEPSWPSPWGAGRPGWHTECVVMSLDRLGQGFDLHCGGLDLVFPHHENERAQAVALGLRFANHWVHNGWVTVEGEKMSKSLGNDTTLSQLMEDADPRAYRILVLRSHYRSPIEVSADTIEQAARSLERLDSLARRFDPPDPFDASGAVVAGEGPTGAADASELDRFRLAMDDDLNTAEALAQIFQLVTSANRLADDGDEAGARVIATTTSVLCGALGLAIGPLGSSGVDDESARLVSERDAARAARDWARADAIRGELVRIGWTVEDGPRGTRIRR